MQKNASEYITFEKLETIFKATIELYPNLPIISVGSGNGIVEYHLDIMLKTNIICVDPNPLSWCKEKKIYKQPMYSYITEIPEEYINNCIVFINWSFPSENGEYDIESIKLLKPKSIITIVETGVYRGAGSLKLHYFLSKYVKTLGHYKDDFIIEDKFNKSNLNGPKIIDERSIVNIEQEYHLFYDYHINININTLEYKTIIKCVVLTVDDYSNIKHIERSNYNKKERFYKYQKRTIDLALNMETKVFDFPLIDKYIPQPITNGLSFSSNSDNILPNSLKTIVGKTKNIISLYDFNQVRTEQAISRCFRDNSHNNINNINNLLSFIKRKRVYLNIKDCIS